MPDISVPTIHLVQLETCDQTQLAMPRAASLGILSRLCIVVIGVPAAGQVEGPHVDQLPCMLRSCDEGFSGGKAPGKHFLN